MNLSGFIQQTDDDVRNILVETVHDYTGPLFGDENIRNFMIREIIPHISATSELGVGSFGKVYPLSSPYEGMVLKFQKVCNVVEAQEGQEGPLSNICRNICNLATKGDIIFKIPDTIKRNKYTLIVPTYLVEPIISAVIGKQKIYGFPTFYGAAFNKFVNLEDKAIYILTEKLKESSPQTPLEMKYTIFCVCYTLFMAQKTMRFVHGDLHLGNIMVRNPPKPMAFSISDVENKYLTFRNFFPFFPVLIDFGLSNLEIYEDGSLIHIIPSLLKIPHDKVNYDAFFFNPYFDILSLLGSLTQRISRKFKRILKEFELFVLGKNLSPREFRFFFEDAFYPDQIDWRPRMDRFMVEDYQKECGITLRTPEEVIGSFIESFISNSEAQVQVLESTKDFILYDTHHLLSIMDTTFLFYRLFPFPETEGRNMASFDNILISAMTTFLEEEKVKEYNREFPPSVVQSCSFPGKQYVTIIAIDPEDPKSEFYQFRLDCCRYDPKHYLQDSTIKSGVVINASYFNSETDYLPIGPFLIGEEVQTNIAIPEGFEKYYGIVALSEGGKSIQFDYDISNISNYKTAFVSGPILIYNKEILFTSDTLREYREKYPHVYDYLFQCRKRKTEDDGRPKIEEFQLQKEDFTPGIKGSPCFEKEGEDVEFLYQQPAIVANCDTLLEGQLSHSGNQNSRTVLALKEGIVFFIAVEGNDERGAGLDMVLLTEILYNSLGVEFAIHLSSEENGSIAWKGPEDNYISIPNPERTYTQPVGTVLSYIRSEEDIMVL